MAIIPINDCQDEPTLVRDLSNVWETRCPDQYVDCVGRSFGLEGLLFKHGCHTPPGRHP